MYHYIYKTSSPSGKFYIGRHSTKDLDDGYLGSGLWVRSIKDKNALIKEILVYCDSYEELIEVEKRFISENIHDSLCMNFNNEAIGFASGDKNPAKRIEQRMSTSKRLIEDNPTKRREVADKISRSLTGKPSGMKGKKLSEDACKNISNGRIGIQYSEEGRKKLSDVRKKHYSEGRRGVPSFKGLSHSEETLHKMKESAIKREKRECIHCGKVCAVNILARFHDDNCKMRYEDAKD